MDRGVVILEGDKPADGTVVDVIPAANSSVPIARHPALGIWRDRADLPDDSVEASKILRERLMRRSDDPVK